ncbi:PRC and DUF2382 domain-containing protein [Agilicoccus flavus]|uniref:PRC and DUF2382 domain-containing protein n=1 Tax=Agilicoccus flavus TaxID=2775968 RepID=UPI001CF69DCE|nr:PRC and DUF2382 domain-containing protein [Agilicoccus flavus]
MFGNDMTQDDLRRLYDATIVDQNGDKVGGVGQIYLDDQNDRPTWATAKTGLFGTKETFVPLAEATMDASEIRVPYTKDFIKDAPNVDAEHHISEQEEDELYRYYNVGQAGAAGVGGVGTDRDRAADPDHGADRGADVGADRPHQNVDRDRSADPDHGADHGADLGADRPHQNVDRDRAADPDHGADHGADAGADAGADSMVRREEQLNVGKERVETGRTRLRKHVVTEQQNVTVPVEREEVHVVREPVREGENVGRIGDGEEEVSVTTHAERPVVEKETVAKERISLDRETVTEKEQVSAEVRKEEVEIEQDGVRDRDDRR